MIGYNLWRKITFPSLFVSSLKKKKVDCSHRRGSVGESGGSGNDIRRRVRAGRLGVLYPPTIIDSYVYSTSVTSKKGSIANGLQPVVLLCYSRNSRSMARLYEGGVCGGGFSSVGKGRSAIRSENTLK